MKTTLRSALAAFLAALILPVLAASPTPPAKDSDSKAILEELRKIRQLLEKLQQPPTPPGVPQGAVVAPPAPEAPVTVSLEGAYVLGKPDAPLTMVEFTDFECPFCRAFHMSSYDQIKREYIDTGKMRYVSRDYPLNFHPNASPAARAARCAGEQGKFWEARHALLVNNTALGGVDGIVAIARGVGVDEGKLRSCIATGKYDAAIQADASFADSIGVSGTPTFVIGRSKGNAVEGLKLVGAQPYPAFDARIKALLTQ
jgi:protein-disulfide isomerase